MAEPGAKPPPHLPYGTWPRRPAWPLLTLIILFAGWLAFLVWLALKYPAR